ncbi:glutathione S-transferase family protein [Paenochrobactrum pullorum]|uniref:glutathione S-transferase family protein n=1 Tax=Paenochrobactrum pullorum TaxID=1324351 RepID=UPI0035BC1E9E
MTKRKGKNMKIWGRDNSGNVKKTLWTAAELGQDVEYIHAGGKYGGLDNPEFLKRNPNGKVPLLEDGMFYLWESNVIVRYLAAKYGKESLWIEDPAERAAAEKWMDWTSNSVAPHFRNIIQHAVRLPQDERDPKILEQSVADLAKVLEIANAHLADNEWMSGKTFGIGDIPLGANLYLWFALPLDRPSLPHIERWYQQLVVRPHYRDRVMTTIE